MKRKNIPTANAHEEKRINLKAPLGEGIANQGNVVFSFAALDKNEYFCLDGTCPNWSQELFDVLKEVSGHTVKELTSGAFSGNSPLRVHRHQNAKPPCEVPNNIDLRDMMQIRISASKGGVHGLLIENVFYIVWLDPQHNLYPDDRHGGLKVIKPPLTCCKDRDKELELLREENKELRKKNSDLQKENDTLMDALTTPGGSLS